MEPNVRVLPSLPHPSTDDSAARRHWSAITIAVAWELARREHRVRPAALAAARDHATWRLSPTASLAECEAVASAAARDFLDRRGGVYAAYAPDPDAELLPGPAWRDAVLGSVTPLHEAVFRLHYGDGVPLEELARRLEVDASWVRAAREAVRELVRVVVAEDGVSTEGWAPERLDRLAGRVALAAGDRCPGPGGLGTDLGRAHAETCPRCARALRLLREGVIAAADLFAPPVEHRVPPGPSEFLALSLHVDARAALRSLAAALPGFVRVDADTLVGPASDAAVETIRSAAREGAPRRAQVRVVRATAPGRLAEDPVAGPAVVGPAVERLRELLGAMPWGEARGVDPLPETLPAPPSAARWWAAAALVLGLASVAGVVATRPPPSAPAVELVASRAGSEVIFDTSDRAYVDVASLTSAHSEVLFHSTRPADKAALATGDGRFRVPADTRPVLVVSAAEELVDLPAIVAVAADMADARQRVADRYPSAAIAVVR